MMNTTCKFNTRLYITVNNTPSYYMNTQVTLLVTDSFSDKLKLFTPMLKFITTRLAEAKK